MNGVIRSYPSNRHGSYGFFSSGQNTHNFESYLSRKGHQDIQPFPQAKAAPERVSVPLPEGTGKAEGVWNAFNGSYTQQDWANYARGQSVPASKKPVNAAATATTALTNGHTTAVASRQAQKPSLSNSTVLAPAPALAPAPTSASSAAHLEFTSTTPVTPTLNSSVFADLLDLDFSPTTSTTTPNIGVETENLNDSTEKAAVILEESTLIDFSDAFTSPPACNEPRSHSASSVTFGEASQSNDHLAADENTTGNSEYDDEDSDIASDSDSDSSDDDDEHLHRQFGVDKSLHHDKDADSDTKGIFIDFATLSNLRTELLEANVTWDDLLTRLKGARSVRA
ncbi:hypothetical protein BGZ96_012141 [Linnemannia gamsii]|uniref:Uncharacterized protein n=1 Tax=Linnemannia gamsii TaxID=64522 RepID=A0ABQ7KHZ5_9FUNG|nr:hypothetical protein BGZ96_012141 [Linnemannia gamsii]